VVGGGSKGIAFVGTSFQECVVYVRVFFDFVIFTKHELFDDHHRIG
jgi:hypothetical protein